MPDGDMVKVAFDKALDAVHSWDFPDWSLLQSNNIPAPVLPINAIGTWAPWTVQSARAANGPVDYSVAALLAYASGCVGNSIVIQPEPETTPGWKEPVCLWVTIVGPPSSGKTPSLAPFKSACAAIEEAERAIIEPMQSAREDKILIAERAEKKWLLDVDIALKSGDEPPPRPAAAIIPPKIPTPRITVGDITIEKLAQLQSENPRGLHLFRDELSGLLSNMSRYSNGSDRPQWLEFYGAGSLLVDRKSLSGPLIVPRAFVSILGGIQPARLEKLMLTDEDGFQARLLYFYPDIPPLVRNENTPPPEELRLALERLRSITLITDEQGEGQPRGLPLANDARDRFFEIRREIRALADEYDGLMAGWIGKGAGLTLRIAGLLCLLDWARESEAALPIEVGTPYLERAMELWRTYFMPMARRALALAGLSLEERIARRIARETMRRGAKVINEREVRRSWSIEELGKDVQRTSKAFNILAASGWIRRAEYSGQGRAPKNWEVNSILFDSFGTNGTDPGN